VPGKVFHHTTGTSSSSLGRQAEQWSHLLPIACFAIACFLLLDLCPLVWSWIVHVNFENMKIARESSYWNYQHST